MDGRLDGITTSRWLMPPAKRKDEYQDLEVLLLVVADLNPESCVSCIFKNFTPWFSRSRLL